MEANSTATLSDRITKWGLRSSWLPFALSLALLCVLIASQIAVGNVAYQVYSQDVFVVLDGVLHLQNGDRIHEDFPSTVGLFYWLPYYLTTFFSPLSGMTVVYGNALVGLFAFALAVFAAKDRVPAMWGATFSLYIGLLAISPRLLGTNASLLNYWNQAFYNRFAWCFISILCLLLAIPRRRTPENFWRDIDAAFCGLLLFILFYVKITYFGAGVGLVCVAMATDFRSNSRQLGLALLALVGAVVVMELLTGITGPYLKDLRYALLVAQPSRLKDLFEISFNNYDTTLLIVLVGGASAILSGVSRLTVPKVLYILAALGASFLLATYNHKSYEIPLVPVITLVAMLAFSPWRGDPVSLWWWRLLLTAVVALCFVKPIALDVGSLVRAERRSFVPDSKLGWLQGTPLSNLVVTQQPNSLLSMASTEKQVCCAENDSEYFYWLADGVTLLKRHVHHGDSVLTFAWSNPFPVLLGLPPVKHDLLWWDVSRTFSAASSPVPSELLAGVNYVMIPKIDMPWGPAPLMKQIYGDELRAKFQPIDESPFWNLFARR